MSSAIIKRPTSLNSIFLLLILATGLFLRLYKWVGYSLWYDEIIWMASPRGGFLNMLTDTVMIFKPPLFKFLLYWWSFLGRGEFVLRLLPVGCGIFSVLFIYGIAKILSDQKAALISALLLSLSSMHIHYSQELTDYSLLTFLSLGSVYYFCRILKENGGRGWIGYVVFTALGLYTNYIFNLLYITEILFFIVFAKKRGNLIRGWLLSQASILILFSPWLFLIPKQVRYLNFVTYLTDWVPRFSFLRMMQLFRIFNGGYNTDLFINLSASVLFFPLFLWGIFLNMKREGLASKFLLFWIFVPLALSFLLSKIRPNFTYRNFIIILPVYYIIIATAAVRLKRYAYLLILPFLVISCLSLYNYYHNIMPYPEPFYRDGMHQRKDIRGASRYVIKNFKDGDLVIHTCLSTGAPFLYYLFSENNIKIMPWMNESPPYTEDSITMPRVGDLPRIVKNRDRIWLVFSAWEPAELVSEPQRSENITKAFLDTEALLQERREFEGVEVSLYRNKN